MNEADELRQELSAIVAEAGQWAQSRRADVGYEVKPDGSLVTPVDREVEHWLRDRLQRLTPGAAFHGEETTPEGEATKGIWFVDPIDGTTNYIFGGPYWGISAAFAQNGNIEAGVVALPDLKEVYSGARGAGARLNGRELARMTSGPIQPYEPVAYCESLVRALGSERLPGAQRCPGAFVVSGGFVASGRFRGLLGNRESIHDIAATWLILTELGADVRFADGEPMHLADVQKAERIARPFAMFPPNSGFFG
ncbi:MAG: inositol monophosphatase family protein [Fimbriimonadaceae bacterium]